MHCLARIAFRSSNGDSVQFYIKHDIINQNLNVYLILIYTKGKIQQKDIERVLDASIKSKIWNLQKYRPGSLMTGLWIKV